MAGRSSRRDDRHSPSPGSSDAPFVESPFSGDPFAIGDDDLFNSSDLDPVQIDVEFSTDGASSPPAPSGPTGRDRPALSRHATKDERRVAPATQRGRAETYREATYMSTLLMVLGGAVAAGATYLGFAQVRPMSTAPLGNAVQFFLIAAIGLVVCLIALGMGIRGVSVARPRHRPVLTILLGLVAVPALVLGAGSMGLTEARRSFQDSAVNDIGSVLVRVYDLIEEEYFDRPASGGTEP